MLGGQDDVKNIANKRSKSSSALPRINNKSIDNINDNNNKLNRSFSKTNIKDNALLFDDADKQNKNNISNYISKIFFLASSLVCTTSTSYSFNRIFFAKSSKSIYILPSNLLYFLLKL